MSSSPRFIALGSLLLLCLAGPAAAQYMRITTDNPFDHTRMRTSGMTILTITLDTNHDRNGALQTCNSHTAANGCGASTTVAALDMFSYTLALKAIGGTVLWGTFTPSDAAYTDVGPPISNLTEIEINQSRPAGTFTPPGLVTIGTLPVTITSGNPSIGLQIGPGALNPFGFGTGFGTLCDGFNFTNTYVVGDPADPCGNISGFAGDWFDWDAAAAPCEGCGNSQPQITAPSAAAGAEGSPFSISATATDPDPGQSLTITIAGQPPSLGPIAPVSGPSPLTATLTGTPTFSEAGTYNIVWTVHDDSGAANATISATTVLTIASTNRPPTLNPIANMLVAEGTIANQTISGSDPDGDALTFSKVSGPTFMTVSTTNATTGNIHLTPGFSDAGAYSATARASDGVASADRSFSILVCNGGCEGTPVLNQPTNMTVTAGASADQAISGSDPSAQPLTFSKVAGPVWMTVTTTSPTTGNIHLAPPLGTSGTFLGTASASNGATTDSKSFIISVMPSGDHPPVLDPIANMLIPCGPPDQAITGSDADGDALTFSKVAGPTFMTVTTTSPTTGNIHVAPGPVEPLGTSAATARASDGTLSDDRSFTITVTASNCAPVLNPVADMTVTEGGTANQTITATDANGNALEFSKTMGPVFMTVTTTSPGTGSASGNIHLAPGLADAGTYSATVSASDGGLTASRVFSITVQTSGNRCPTSNPGGPYVGIAGVPITFNGSASSDPDGNPLTYAWDFDASDGIQVDAVGVIATHTYAVDGLFVASLTVTDNGDGDPAQVCSDRRGTSVQVNLACPAMIFNGYDTIRLGSGKPLWFAYVQPASDCYANTDVITSSFVMRYAGRQIPAETTKTTIGGDKNGDGIQEIKVNWTKENLRALFSGTGLSNGHNNVTVTIEGDLVSGGKLRGTTQLDVVNNGSFTIAAVAPNPLNPEATLTYTTTRQGPVRIDMFDIQGRLVRRLVDATAVTAGTHDVTIDGRGERGEKLSSGVYYIRGTSSEGEFKHLITILK